MTSERWNKIKTLFQEAEGLPADDLSAFLDRNCEGDAELRAEVEKLIAAGQLEDEFLQNSAIAEAASLFEGEPTAGIGSAPSEVAPPRFQAGILLKERYEIIRLLGRGGMGEVYLASDRRINRNVTIKVLHSELVANKESLGRFAVETQAVSALNHPHIMTIHEFDSANEDTPFFVAEYVDGRPLNHLIGPTLELQKALDIAIQVTSALSAAHEAGIIHRDIKPENIMVRRDGYVKVLDFGLAKLAQNRPTSPNSGSEDQTIALLRTKPGMVMGTAAYMSPEQARGRRVDARTDIWSLGVVIYEMLTAHRPFTGETQADLTVAVLRSEPAPISDYVSGAPPELDWIVSKALSKEVEGRYQTSAELRADLEKVKKKIEFDESLSRSGKALSGKDRITDQDKFTALEPGALTDAAAARPTSDGQNGQAGPTSFLSLPGVEVFFQQAKAKKIGFSAIALIVVGLISVGLYFV
ncbi:MAG: serine/threonine protein kinase, partial [Acidobacteria bacterium]|nr:serine/threonine protein kinase [Acidobacteriota bacterium]